MSTISAHLPLFTGLAVGKRLFLRSGAHTTMCFTRHSSTSPDIYIEQKFTLDPNEEMECESVTPENAALVYATSLEEGYRVVDGWHKDKGHGGRGGWGD